MVKACGSKIDLPWTCGSVDLVFTPGEPGSVVGTEDVRANRAVEASPDFFGDCAPCHRGLTVDSWEGLHREKDKRVKLRSTRKKLDAAGRRETEGRGRNTD